MEIRELLYKRSKLEREISSFIQEKVVEFSKETGLGINRIGISIGNIYEFGTESPIAAFVKTDVDLKI